MSVKLRLLFYLLTAALIWACTSGRMPARDQFVGNYIFFSADAGAPHDADSLSLLSNGTYRIVNMPFGRRGSEEKGIWYLTTERTPNIVLGKSGYPIEIKGTEIRLIVNDDLDEYYRRVGVR